MSFKDTQSYKELQSDWRWIHSMDPEAFLPEEVRNAIYNDSRWFEVR